MDKKLEENTQPKTPPLKPTGERAL